MVADNLGKDCFSYPHVTTKLSHPTIFYYNFVSDKIWLLFGDETRKSPGLLVDVSMATKKRVALSGSGKTSKRATPRGQTPVSLGSSDEYSLSGEEASETEAEDLRKAVKLFSGQTASSHGAVAERDSRGIRNYSRLPLKSDHEVRPLWVDPEKNRILLESFSPLAKGAQDFLIHIAEPISRPSFIHEYHLTTHSLYAAVSVGLTPKDILNTLNKYLKTPLPQQMVDFIKSSSKSYGKVKLVLKSNQFYLETSDPVVLQILLKDKVISEAIQSRDVVVEQAPTAGPTVLPGTKEAAGIRQQTGQDRDAEFDKIQAPAQGNKPDEYLMALTAEDEDEDDEQLQNIHSVVVPSANAEAVARRCLEMGYPMLEEYDFPNDKQSHNLAIDLKPGAKIRDYQEKSLGKMFANGRSRSGIIVLPCGAGKTLVGITAACTIRKGTIVLCTSSMSVNQWRAEFLKWSNISPSDIAIFTAENKQPFSGQTGIVVSTYSMVTQTKTRSHDSQKMMDFLKGRDWGLMILDEVHVVPASIFRKVAHEIKVHSKLGLTATLVREDDKITDLNFLIGPKLYEANWMELSEQGHIAKVQCAEVWCSMTTEFYQEYLRESSRKRALLYIMNPRKFQACQYLIDFHEKRGDKIIVFSDNVYALERYAKKLNKAYIYGGTPHNERVTILDNFQRNEQINTLFLSKIGDTSLDLPEATCLIQISSHYGSRRQEAQRLGRILRAKRRNDEGFNAFFYSLVSKDTQEMYYSSKRQAFLVDQGYSFKVITHLQGIENLKGLAYATPSERRELLQEVMLQNETSAEVEKIDDDMFSRTSRGKAGAKGAKRTAGTLSELSGGRDMAYIEYNKSKNKELRSKNGALFKKLASEQKKRKKELMDMT